MLLSDLQFASFLTYAPHGTTPEMLESRRWTRLLKQDQAVKTPSEPPGLSRPMNRFIVEILINQIAETSFSDFFGPGVTLVPVPKSSLLPRDGLWVPQRIASSMVEFGLGKEVLEILMRIQAVPKSATSASGDRPKAKTHYDSLRVNPQLEPPRRIVLVDDVITRGATLLGAASCLAEAFPQATIQGFAMVRTISNPEQFVKIVNPCVGWIRLRDGDTFRDP